MGIETTVFKGSPLTKLILLAIGVALIAVGITMAFGQAGSFFDDLLGGMRPSAAGWLLSAIGLVTTILALMSISRGCPRLELNNEGIIYSQCLRGIMRVSWSDLARTEIKRVKVPSSTEGDVLLEAVMLVTADGRKIELAPVAPVRELYDAITHAAANARAMPQKG